MKLRKFLSYIIISLCFIICLTGCAEENKVEEEKNEDVVKGNCAVTECIKQLDTSKFD